MVNESLTISLHTHTHICSTSHISCSQNLLALYVHSVLVTHTPTNIHTHSHTHPPPNTHTHTQGVRFTSNGHYVCGYVESGQELMQVLETYRTISGTGFINAQVPFHPLTHTHTHTHTLCHYCPERKWHFLFRKTLRNLKFNIQLMYTKKGGVIVHSFHAYEAEATGATWTVNVISKSRRNSL